MKTLIKMVLGGLGVVVAVAIGAAGYLIYPGTPSKASSLVFNGFVPLRADGMLSILDYLTVNDDMLFITNERTGAVYRVPIRTNSLPGAADGAILPGVSRTQ